MNKNNKKTHFSYLYMNFQPCKMDYLIATLFVWNHQALKLTFLMVENGKTRANNYWDRCFEMKIDRPPHYQPHDLLNKFPLYLKRKKICTYLGGQIQNTLAKKLHINLIWTQLEIKTCKGSFNNYVDQILSNFDLSPFKWIIVDILHATYPLSCDQVRTFY